jgi:hypothetical protein
VTEPANHPNRTYKFSLNSLACIERLVASYAGPRRAPISFGKSHTHWRLSELSIYIKLIEVYLLRFGSCARFARDRNRGSIRERNRPLNLPRRLVFSQSQIHDLPQQIILRPAKIAYFNNEFWAYPVHAREHEW